MPAVRPSLAVPAAILLALCLAACGDGSGGQSGSWGDSTTARSKAEHEGGVVTKDDTLAKLPPARLCQSQLGAFVGSMDSLRRRLAVGLTYDQYVDEVHGVRDTYGRVPVEAVQIDCLAAVGAPAEKAFNRYIAAANEWGECVSEAGCESADVEPALQREWRIAAHFLGEARQGLGEETAKPRK